MKKYNGFTVIETIVAMSILMMLIATVVPIATMIQEERAALKTKRTIARKLHDELVGQIYMNGEQKNKEVTIDSRTTVYLTFERENAILKGCATWTDEKDEENILCLTGMFEE